MIEILEVKYKSRITYKQLTVIVTAVTSVNLNGAREFGLRKWKLVETWIGPDLVHSNRAWLSRHMNRTLGATIDSRVRGLEYQL